jgi:multiple sugar transport system substrate-binding protein
MLSRRDFLRTSALSAGVAAGVGGLAAACGGGGGETAADMDSISFLNWDPVEKGSPLSNAIAAFQKESGIKVQVQPVPTTDYDTKLLTMMSSGDTPDIIRINDDFVLGYSQQGTLLDLNTYLERDGLTADMFFDHPFNFPVQSDGKHTAWAAGTQPNLVFYNVDAFEEAGVPLPPTTWTDDGWKWEDFLAAAKELTIPDQRFGVLTYDDTSSETVFTVNNGTEGIYSKDGKRFTLADPKSVEGIQWIADLTLQHKVQPPWSTIQGGESNPNFALSLFTSGKVAMMTRNFGSAAYIAENAKDFRWDIAPIPGRLTQKTISTLTVWAIPAKAKSPDQAWELLKYFAETKGATELAKQRDLIPANKEAAAVFEETPDGPPEHMALVVEATENGVNENFSRNIQQAREIYRPQLDLIYSGQQTAAEALGAVKDRVEQALAGS